MEAQPMAAELGLLARPFAREGFKRMVAVCQVSLSPIWDFLGLIETR